MKVQVAAMGWRRPERDERNKDCVNAVDDPEIFVALVVKSRISSSSGRTISVEKRSFCPDWDDIFLGVFHDAVRFRSRLWRERYQEDDCGPS